MKKGYKLDQFLAGCRETCSEMLLYCRAQCWVIWMEDKEWFSNTEYECLTSLYWERCSTFKTFFTLLLPKVLHMALIKVVFPHCAELATKTIICQLKPAFAYRKMCDSNKSHWRKRPLSNSASLLLLEQGKHWIICGHQCLVVTWSFMDQLFPFWFNSPCDWFSVRYCWKISTLNRAWNRESFEYRCLRLRPCHWKPLGARRQLQVDYVASDRSCNSFVQGRDICI